MKAKAFGGREKIRLPTLGSIRTEMGVVYRSAVRGEIPWADATKACYVLNLIARLDEGQLFEQRIAALEDSMKPKPNGHARPEARP